MSGKANNWSRDELKMAISLYCKIPFKSTRKESPEIIRWAKIIGRSPGGLYAKLCNLGNCDKAMQDINVKGLSHTGKLDPIMWNEFVEDPERIVYEGELLLAQHMGLPIEKYAEIDENELPSGEMREVVIRQRINQRFFRNAVLVAYENRCCISGISNSSLLDACHISSWKDDIKNRTNPKNGLCMNPLFHRAFDKYLICVTPDYTIEVSEQMLEITKEETFRRYLLQLHHTDIHLPNKFSPDKELLAIHYERFRQNS